MYIESKAAGLNGPARICRVYFSKTGRTLYYKDQEFIRTSGFKANHLDVKTREEYWISCPRRDGKDRLYVSNIPIDIDEDVRTEYWAEIRKNPECVNLSSA